MEKFGLDIKLLIAQLTNFLIFFFIFKKFISKPFEQFIQNEEKKEEAKQRMLEDLETKHTRMQEEEKKWRKEIQAEKEAVLAETKKLAETVKADAVAQAKKESEELLAKTEKQIKEERETLYSDVKKRTVDLSTYIVEKGLEEYLTDEAKRNLTKHIVDNLGKDISKYEN